MNLHRGYWVIVRVMETSVTYGFRYGFGHDSQIPQVLAVAIFEKVMETVRTTICAGVPGGRVPEAAEKGIRERLIKNNEGIAGLPERVEEGNVPGSDGVGGRRDGGHPGHEASSGSLECKQWAECTQIPFRDFVLGKRGHVHGLLGEQSCRSAQPLGLSPDTNVLLVLLPYPPSPPNRLSARPRRAWIGCTITISPTHGIRSVPLSIIPVSSLTPLLVCLLLVSRPGWWRTISLGRAVRMLNFQ